MEQWKIKDFAEYLSLSQYIDALKKEIDDADETLEILDSKIAHFEELGLTDTVDELCREYCALNVRKIEAEIQYHKLCIKQLEEEKDIALEE